MQESNPNSHPRTLSPRQILSWAEHHTEIMRLHTHRDVLPGGYMAAMLPALVSWGDLDTRGQSPSVILRHVNYGGNPLEGITILHSVRIPLDGVEAAEFMLVPLGRPALAHHGQLRFIFAAGKEPELLNLAGSGSGTDTRIPDLVLSWEAWRCPDRKFNVLQGLDSNAFDLSLRAYAGAQRFLEDTLRGQDWIGYRLRLPGGREGLRELLRTTLALGDGVARNTMTRLLERGKHDWLQHAPGDGDDGSEATDEFWQDLQQRLHRSGIPRHSPLNLPPEQQSYNTLLRSCATMARYAVLLAAHRLVHRGYRGDIVPEKLPPPDLGAAESWMTRVAHTNLRGIFAHAPSALRFIVRNPAAVPGKIPRELDTAGLLQQRGGRRWKIRYSRDGLRPYGPFGINRIS